MEGAVLRFEAMILDVLTLVNVCLNIVFSWHMTPCSLLDKYQRFAGKYCLLLEDNCDLKGGRRALYPNVGACVRSFTVSHVRRKQPSQCEILSRNLCGGPEEKYERPLSRLAVSGPRFECGTSRIRIRGSYLPYRPSQ
jgi:hypothetical protein